jgi:PIN domain nuclease of toxin-antitoxin system
VPPSLVRTCSSPFDRPLIAQARQEGFTLVTADPRIHAYDVTVLDPLT